MEKIEFTILGSKGDTYTVIFLNNNNVIAISCTCKAGTMSQQCKHRRAILEGDTSAITSGNKDQVNEIVELIKNTALEEALAAFNEANRQVEVANKKLAQAKKFLSQKMHEHTKLI